MFDFSVDVLAVLCAISTLAGFVDAVAGGGGLLVIPALLAAGIGPVGAIATNKIQASLGTASAAFTFWRAGHIDLRLLTVPLVATFAGAVLGALALLVADTRLLLIVLPILLIAIALYFLLAPSAGHVDRIARLSSVAYAGVAGAVGFYDGFFGPGTGSFFALSLVTLMGMGLVRATAHTKVLNLTSNLVSLFVFATGGQVLWTLGFLMAIGNFFGGWLGSNAAMRFGPAIIRPLLVVISLAMTVKLLLDPANPLRQLIQNQFL